MATKTISITEEAYNRLKARKRGTESFTEVIYKITNKKSLLDVAGALSKEEADELEKTVKEGRKLADGRAKKISEMIAQ